MRRPKLIPILLIAFPLGLIVLGVGSFFLPNNDYGGIRELPSQTKKIANDPSIQKKALLRHVQVLSQTIGERHLGKPRKIAAAAAYIESTLSETNAGYRVKKQQFAVQGKECTNIFVQKTGRRYEKDIIIIGAHYDSAVGSPGADDNATGVAILLELAKSFVNQHLDRTIRFVAFTNEEMPHFNTPNMGSYRYARACKEAGERIVGMISLESLGFFTDAPHSQQYPPQLQDQDLPEQGNFIAVVGDPSSTSLIKKWTSLLNKNTTMLIIPGTFPKEIPGIAFSDHASFWKFGYPALMLTDTAPFRNPHYHKQSDTWETIDFEKLTLFTRALKEALLSFSKAQP